MHLPASVPSPHPLDPLHAVEIKAASKIILGYLRVTTRDVRFKVVDLYEPAKDETLQFIHHGGAAPDRRCRAYFHQLKSPILSIAIVNVTKGVVESCHDAPDSQGPVDWVEYDLVHKACLSHPKILEEVAKLKLPAGYHLPPYRERNSFTN